ncbi:suppressor of fused domain protein [Archangium lansingense]|uniref:Suppressor of fused domain protein n=1 Tax=Archangium lansingense TaxID=2995310 RepID=A0ABT4A8K7_9BACT|nr:suppressor of fused domain protein [Archangium lansinium]MCY1077987.1 suppressor of fused domain protein [Archangium lansinium]
MTDFVRPGVWRCEFVLVLPPDLGGASFRSVASFVMDFVLYARQPEVNLRSGCTAPESKLLPAEWPTRAVMVTEPLGEPEELETLHVGTQHVNLWWLVPIHGAEYNLIQQQGIEAFHALEEASEWSLADVRRPPLV